MNYCIRYLFIIILLIPLSAYTLNLDHMLDNGPLIAVNRDNNGKFESITAYNLVYAPLQYVWDTVLNIEDYALYISDMIKSEIIKRNEDNTEFIAGFKVRTFMTSTNYQLKYKIDKINHIIVIDHHSGALKDSQWRYEFQKQGDDTIIICTGASRNLSRFIDIIDNNKQTISIGINISSTLANMLYIKERSESLYSGEKDI